MAGKVSVAHANGDGDPGPGGGEAHPHQAELGQSQLGDPSQEKLSQGEITRAFCLITSVSVSRICFLSCSGVVTILYLSNGTCILVG